MNSPLFSTNDLFTSFFESSPVFIWIKDCNNNLIHINKAAASLEGKSVEELEGKSCYDIYTRERADVFWENDLEVINSGQPKLSYYELHIIPNTDIGKWLQVNKLPVKNSEGIITGVMVYAIDITEIKLAEEETRKKEEKTQQLMDIAPFPIIITALLEDKFIYLNNAAIKLFNLKLDDIFKIKPSEIYTDKSQREHFKQLLTQFGEIKSEEVTFTRQNGELIYGLLSTITIDYKGIPCSYNVFNDISNLKKNEQKIIQIAEEFRMVFENTIDAFFWADSDTGIIINCNRSAEELLQMEKCEIIGKYHWEIHPKQDKEKYRNLFANLDKTSPGGLLLEVEDSQGNIIPVNITASTVNLGNRCISQALITNVSERIANEKALKESEEKYHAIVSNAPVGFFEIDKNGIIKLLEGKGISGMYFDNDRVIGKSIYEVYKEKPEFISQTQKALQGETLNFALEINYSHYEFYYSPIKGTNGEISSIIGVVVDVSDKKSAEQKLFQEKNLLSTLIDIIPDLIYVKDAESKFLLANKSTAAFFNINSPEEMLGKSDFDLFPIEEAHVFHNEEKGILFDGKQIINMEIKSISNGSEIFHEITKIPYFGTHGEIVGLVGISRDITQRRKNEAAVRESELKFRLMAENMKDVIWQLSTDMDFLYISPSFTQLTGEIPSEYLGKPLWSLITEESAPAFKDKVNKRKEAIIKKEKIGTMLFEASYNTKKGLIWAEIISNPIYNENDDILYFQGVARDITQRKSAELALKESQEKLSVVVANAPIVLFQIDKKGVFLFSDGKGLEKLGIKPGQVVGMSVYDVYKDFPDICSHIDRALKGETLIKIVNVYNIYFEIQYNPLKDISGEIISVIGIALDITERKIMEEALSESEHRFSTLFHEMNEGVAIHDLVFDENGIPANYKFIEVNPAYAKQTGIDTSNAKDMLITDLLNIPHPPNLDKFSAVALNGEKFSSEFYFEPTERYLKVSAISPGKNKFAAVYEDITLQKKHEKELKDKNEELEHFTYTVSHDLKSPLVTIKGFIGMLEQDLLHQNKENIRDDMQRITSATDKMTSLLNDLLDLSRIGRVINPPVKVSMLSVIKEAIELLSGILKEREVEIEIAENLPYVFIDKQRFVEVWQNLIENAVKFSKDQQNPKILITYIKEDIKFIFTIQDNGIGIDPKYHNIIFGLFNKLNNKTNGTGIGLALVKRIIEVHGGGIWVESEGQGSGAKFSFTVPVKNFKK